MIQEIVGSYLKVFPEETAALGGLSQQLAANEDLSDRKNFKGHITGGAIILSPDNTKLLLVYHKLFNKWLQPGGHWEADEPGPWDAARREAIEETGAHIGELLPMFDDWRTPLDIGTHPIPRQPKKQEPDHPHHDFQYVFRALDEEIHPRIEEVNILDIAWVPLENERMQYLAIAIAKLRHCGIIS